MPDPLVSLLDVQDRDLVADQLRHRRATLQERGQLAEQDALAATISVELAGLDEQLADLGRTQKRLEDEVATVEAKRSAENVKLYAGTVTSPRELQAMQEEIDALGRRQRELEDSLIEIMEAVEPIAEAADGLRARHAAALAQAASLGTALADAELIVDRELAELATVRAAAAAHVPTDLLETYEKLRAHLGGVGVARLDGTQCSGCHLSLPATELDALRHAVSGTVVYHEECGRILVR